MSKTSKTEEARYLNHDNSWNREGLLGSRTDEDGEVVCCSKSGEQLFFVKKNGKKVRLISYGECYNCQKLFAASQLKTSDGMSSSSYPVVYVGAWCLDCNKLPESEWRENKKDEQGSKGEA